MACIRPALAVALLARELRALRAIYPVRQGVDLSQNRPIGLQSSPSWFTCYAIGFNIHKPGIHHVVSSFGGDGARAQELFEANNDNADSFLNGKLAVELVVINMIHLDDSNCYLEMLMSNCL